MKRTTGARLARKLLPYVATILSASMAVTLRVERSCSDTPAPIPQSVPRLIYPYSEILSVEQVLNG